MTNSVFNFRAFNGRGGGLRFVAGALFFGVLPLALVLSWVLPYIEFQERLGSARALMEHDKDGVAGKLQLFEDSARSYLNILRATSFGENGEITKAHFDDVAGGLFANATSLRAVEYHTFMRRDVTRSRSRVMYGRGSFVREGQTIDLPSGLTFEGILTAGGSNVVSSRFFYNQGGDNLLWAVALPDLLVTKDAPSSDGFFVLIYDVGALVKSLAIPVESRTSNLFVSDGVERAPLGDPIFEPRIEWSKKVLGSVLRFTMSPAKPMPGFLFSNLFFFAIACSAVSAAMVIMAYIAIRTNQVLAFEKAKAEERIRTRDAEHIEHISAIKRQLAAKQMLEIASVSSQIAHELRNKLSSPKTLPAALDVVLNRPALTDKDRRTLRKYISLSNEALNAIEMTLTGLTSLGKASTSEPKLTAVNPGVLLHVAWKAILSSVQESRVTMRVINPSEEGLLYVMDYGLGLQAMAEILRNCVDACKVSTNDPRQIETSFYRTVGLLPAMHAQDYSEGMKGNSEWGVIRVTDNGCGMNAADVQRMFLPTFTTKQGEVRGLGLFRVCEIMAMHRGVVTVTSQPGKGTTICLYFRLTDQIPFDAAQVSDLGTTAGLVFGQREGMHLNKLALIVDDESYVRITLSEILSSHGVRSVEACSGEEAIDLLTTTDIKPDLIFIDHRLGPGMGGMAVAEELRGKGSWDIVHCSATLGTEGIAEGEYNMPKPFGPEEVAALLQRVYQRGPQDPASSVG